MGALTINRKRSEDYCKNPSLDFTHVAKRPKLSSPSLTLSPDPGRPVSAKSIIWRCSRYPAVVAPLKREIHAPCRRIRFGFSANLKNSSSDCEFREKLGRDMGNFIGKVFKKEKQSSVDSLRYGKRAKEVIELADDDDNGARIDNVSEDSSIEEIEVVEKEKERAVCAQKDGDGDVEMLDKPSSSSVFTEMNRKVESPVRIFDLMPRRPEFDNMDLPLYKKLLNTVEKKYPENNFKELDFEIKLHEKRLQTYQLLRPQRKSEELIEDVITEPFVPLTEEEEAEVAYAFSNKNGGRVLVTHENSNIDITGRLLQCLKPGLWLNDEVINVYLELLKEREKREPKKFMKCHFFNTFFYKKLISGKTGYNYQSVRRWTTQRKLGYSLFDCDKIFVPIHKEIHWCLAVINKKDRKFQYLDSLGGRDPHVLRVLARYYADEVKDKSGELVNVSSWEQEFVEDLPEQENGFDCGVFMIKYADFYSRNIGLCFNQEHMPYFRLRTAKEILRLKAE